MKRCYRLRAHKRFREVRQHGRSYSCRLLVLCCLPNDLPCHRFGFSVSRRVGKAVVRNQIKRRLRESIRLRRHQIQMGWDIVFIARAPIRSAGYPEIDAACARLLRRASLLLPEYTAAAEATLAPGSSRDAAGVTPG